MPQWTIGAIRIRSSCASSSVGLLVTPGFAPATVTQRRMAGPAWSPPPRRAPPAGSLQRGHGGQPAPGPPARLPLFRPGPLKPIGASSLARNRPWRRLPPWWRPGAGGPPWPGRAVAGRCRLAVDGCRPGRAGPGRHRGTLRAGGSCDSRAVSCCAWRASSRARSRSPRDCRREPRRTSSSWRPSTVAATASMTCWWRRGGWCWCSRPRPVVPAGVAARARPLAARPRRPDPGDGGHRSPPVRRGVRRRLGTARRRRRRVPVVLGIGHAQRRAHRCRRHRGRPPGCRRRRHPGPDRAHLLRHGEHSQPQRPWTTPGGERGARPMTIARRVSPT